MTLCSENHDEVCYEGRDCPACKLFTETETLSGTIEDLNDVIRERDDQIQELKEELNGERQQ
jgi:hypothetical protein